MPGGTLISDNFADVLDVRFRDVASGAYDRGKVDDSGTLHGQGLRPA